MWSKSNNEGYLLFISISITGSAICNVWYWVFNTRLPWKLYISSPRFTRMKTPCIGLKFCRKFMIWRLLFIKGYFFAPAFCWTWTPHDFFLATPLPKSDVKMLGRVKFSLYLGQFDIRNHKICVKKPKFRKFHFKVGQIRCKILKGG